MGNISARINEILSVHAHMKSERSCGKLTASTFKQQFGHREYCQVLHIIFSNGRHFRSQS